MGYTVHWAKRMHVVYRYVQVQRSEDPLLTDVALAGRFRPSDEPTRTADCDAQHSRQARLFETKGRPVLLLFLFLLFGYFCLLTFHR